MKKWTFVAIGMLFISCGNSDEEKENTAVIDSLQQEIRELKEANDTLSDHLMRRTYITKLYPKFFDSIPNPEDYLLKKLQEDQETIPKEPVLGGTMRFTRVSFINDDLLVVEYEDGHVMGKAIYTYKIPPGGEPEFELITEIE